MLKEPSPSRIVSAYLKKANGKYYWSPRDQGLVKPGFRVPPARLPLHPTRPEHKRVEAIFEKVRREQFPNRPSRIGAKFVCPSLKGWCKPKVVGTGSGSGIYEVSVSGKVFETDSEYYTEAAFAAGSRADDETLSSWAESYWEGRSGAPFFPEVVVQGTVTVIRSVFMGSSYE